MNRLLFITIFNLFCLTGILCAQTNSTKASLEAYNTGVAFQESGRPELALTQYDLAIELSPNFADPYLNRANLRLEKKDFAGALADYGKLIELNPKNHEGYFNRAVVNFEAGN